MTDHDERVTQQIDAMTARADRAEQTARWTDTPLPTVLMTDEERAQWETKGWVR